MDTAAARRPGRGPISHKTHPDKPHSVLKRSHDESDKMNTLSSSKKVRVKFEKEVEDVPIDEIDEADPQVVREQVRRAIQRHCSGEDETGYERIITIFSADPTDLNAPAPKVVHVHLLALLSHISSLNHQCNDLIGVILSSEWVGRDKEYTKLYGKVLANLAAASSGHLTRICKALVDLLGPQRTRRLRQYALVRQDEIHERARIIMLEILTLFAPAAGSYLQVIRKKLSIEFKKPRDRLIYMQNFLRTADSMSALKSATLAIITAELVKLDVSVQVDMDDYSDDLEEDLVQEVSQQSLVSPKKADMDGDDSSSEEEDLEAWKRSPEEKHRLKIMAHLETVDAIMEMLFVYLDQMTPKSSPPSDETVQLLNNHFTNIILPTQRSRHAQFLVFHFAQTSSFHVERFATACVCALIDIHQQSNIRQSAGAYLAGFVGRGAHIPAGVVRSSFELLCEELDAQRLTLEPRCKGPDLRRYTTFYSTMQAIMYIFCFRWRELAETDDEEEDSDSDSEADTHTNLRASPETYRYPHRIKSILLATIHSPLNPLRVCTLDIVNQFAETCRRVNLIYIFPKLESNKYVRLDTVRRGEGDAVAGHVERDLAWVGETGMLEAYFPFDPYKLPRSGRWVEGDYLEWKGLPGDEDEEEDEETEDVGEEEDEDDTDMMETEDDSGETATPATEVEV